MKVYVVVVREWQDDVGRIHVFADSQRAVAFAQEEVIACTRNPEDAIQVKHPMGFVYFARFTGPRNGFIGPRNGFVFVIGKELQ